MQEGGKGWDGKKGREERKGGEGTPVCIFKFFLRITYDSNSRQGQVKGRPR